MAHETQITMATPADIAADMEEHRKTYQRFLRVIVYTCIGAAIVLTALFLSY